MFTVKQNRSIASLSARITEQVEEKAKPNIKLILYDVAQRLTDLSPVWSGAYVTSHSFVPKGSGAGRMRISKEENGPQDFASKRAEGLEQLQSDIESFDFFEAGGGVFRNRAPHARGVEDGEPPAQEPYNVYGATLNYALARKKRL